ncbi:MAG: adenosylcobinamide-phosphate synthase CbiB [Hyphomicrobium sp.]|uniref:adenosylcobinamide-phosphate synthase CbiB n=1 Tax=Hyphomicrobium sp. TaxID=82 RepID=UPI0039E457E0
MTAGQTLFVLVGALVLEATFGYPDWLYQRIGHPVSWIGRLISFLDQRLNRESDSTQARRRAGMVALLIIVAVPGVIAWLVEDILDHHVIGPVVVALFASTLIASRSLYDHVGAVARALDQYGLQDAREAVGRIVGRNPQTLDEHGVARAAIESLAENASDGIVAPVFWFAILGLPGFVAYKAINTADSMIGHRTPRHEAFGWASARLDDLVNLPASRLTALLLAVAAMVTPGASTAGALEAVSRDASKHRSPNAGWPESAIAGALGLKLNGPKVYGEVRVEDAYMGDGRRDATADDIRAALRLTATAWGIMVATLLFLAIILQD